MMKWFSRLTRSDEACAASYYRGFYHLLFENVHSRQSPIYQWDGSFDQSGFGGLSTNVMRKHGHFDVRHLWGSLVSTLRL